MKAWVSDYMVCPYCAKNLALRVLRKEQTEILSGKFSCVVCKRYYPIIQGIPRMLPDALMASVMKRHAAFFRIYKKEFPARRHVEGERIKKRTAEVWGYQWTYFTNLIKESEEQFLRWIAPVQRSFFRGKLILDAGCGTGRHAYFSAKFGARVIGIDLSDAVETAHHTTKNMGNVGIVQADIYHLPFRDRTFDYAYSIGVIHHLPDPEQGFREVLKKVRKNGAVSVWVYGKEHNGFIVYGVEPIRKLMTRHMNLRVLNGVSYLVTLPYYASTKLIYGPFNKIPGVRRVMKRAPYNEYFVQFSRFGFKHHWMNVFDKLNAPLAAYYTKKDLEGWIKRSGLKGATLIPVNRISWALFGQR